ncbi:hypothetical protein HaLaN_20729, partial [Haematococcus lacustris]
MEEDDVDDFVMDEIENLVAQHHQAKAQAYSQVAVASPPKLGSAICASPSPPPLARRCRPMAA